MKTKHHLQDETSSRRKGLIKKIFAYLGSEQFRGGSQPIVWRQTNRKIDVLKVEFFPPSLCHKWHVPVGSFSVKPGCFFPFIPSINTEPVAEDQRKITQPQEKLCQVRLNIFKTIRQSNCPPPNVWWVGANESEFDMVTADVLSRLRQEALPFYARFENIGELLRTLKEDEGSFGAAGVWDFGRKDSPIRLFYIGFCALECELWNEALSALMRCREKAREMFWKDRLDILSCIDSGIERAKRKASELY